MYAAHGSSRANQALDSITLSSTRLAAFETKTTRDLDGSLVMANPISFVLRTDIMSDALICSWDSLCTFSLLVRGLR